MQQEEIDSNQKCCLNCKWFEERTGFCRKNPPQSIPVYVKGIGQLTNNVWPKIPMPNVDWCSYFDNANEKQLI